MLQSSTQLLVFLIINNKSQQEAPNICKDHGTIPNPCTHLVPMFVGHGRTKRAPEKQHAVSTLKEDSRQLCVEGGRWEKKKPISPINSSACPHPSRDMTKVGIYMPTWPWPSLLRWLHPVSWFVPFSTRQSFLSFFPILSVPYTCFYFKSAWSFLRESKHKPIICWLVRYLVIVAPYYLQVLYLHIDILSKTYLF